jgi:hypothetical protein
MAVAKVYGKVDGHDVIFQRSEDAGRWTTTVPASQTGTYIMELWAEDEAGNVGYFATIKVTFDPSQLCVAISVLEVGANWTLEEVMRTLQCSDIQSGLGPESFSFVLAGENILSEITRCEVCGA